MSHVPHETCEDTRVTSSLVFAASPGIRRLHHNKTGTRKTRRCPPPATPSATNVLSGCMVWCYSYHHHPHVRDAGVITGRLCAANGTESYVLSSSMRPRYLLGTHVVMVRIGTNSMTHGTMLVQLHAAAAHKEGQMHRHMCTMLVVSSPVWSTTFSLPLCALIALAGRHKCTYHAGNSDRYLQGQGCEPCTSPSHLTRIPSNNHITTSFLPHSITLPIPPPYLPCSMARNPQPPT